MKPDAALKPEARPCRAAIPTSSHGRIGVLLLNLGTPDATDYWSMRRYLKEFLSDRRVIEVPRWKWWPILNLIILTVRPGRKGKDYDTIWNKERNEGPLKTITRSQAEKLQRALADDPRVIVDWAMRYANPSTESRIAGAEGRAAATASSWCRSIRSTPQRRRRPRAMRLSAR